MIDLEVKCTLGVGAFGRVKLVKPKKVRIESPPTPEKCAELTGTVTNDGVTSKEVVKTKTRAGRRVTRPRRLIEEIN